jgi:hypothetical protein
VAIGRSIPFMRATIMERESSDLVSRRGMYLAARLV